MIIYLPKPYPNELLYSVVARYIKYTGLRHIYSLKTDLLGGDSLLSPFLPRGLSIVSERTWAVWHMSAREIAHRLTMYPFYVAFIPSPKKEQVINGLLDTSSSTVIRYLVSRVVPNCLRYCPICRNKDLAKHGETYWHRTHQMKGAAICPDHGKELIEVQLTAKTTGADLINPTEATCTGRMLLQNLTEQEEMQLVAIARRCRSMLEERVDPQWQHADPALYRTIAVEKGLCSGIDGCRKNITRRFNEMYSDRVIKTFGLWNSASSWVNKMFSRTNGAQQPIAHAVIQEFLSTVTGDSSNAIFFGFGPWKCPNPLGPHNSLFPIKKVIVRRENGRNVARTTCCCGFGFKFYTTDTKDNSMPVVHKVTEYSPSWEEEIRRRYATGMDASQIGFDMNVPASEVERIITGISETNKDFLCSLRRQWSNLLKTTQHHSVTEAHRLDARLYKIIKRSDPNFLICTLSKKQHLSHSPHRNEKIELHWKEKDAALSTRLRTAAESILKEVPPTRVSKRALLRKSNISAWALRRELQECNQVLRDMSESTENFQKRRLRYLAEKAKAQGIKPKRNQLFYSGSIRAEKDKKRLEKYVDSLCE